MLKETRRDFLRIVGLSAAGLVLSACRGKAAPEATPKPISCDTPSPEATPKPISCDTPSPEATPKPILCNTPSIGASVGNKTAEAEYIKSYLGERKTLTSRRLLINKPWNVELTPAELKVVEETWQDVKVCIPEGLTGRVFAGGIEQGINRYETGALITLESGVYDFKMRNGEVVVWYPDQKSSSDQDLDRIVKQIENGNFDIKNQLAFLGVTTDLLPQIPADLVRERNVQIIPSLKPVRQ